MHVFIEFQLTVFMWRSKLLAQIVSSTHRHRRYGRLQLTMAVLLAMVMCWVGERTSLPEAAARGGPAVERSNADTLPLGKLAESNVEQLVEGELADDSDIDALLVNEAALGFASVFRFRQFDSRRELNDWRARSSVSARGPPIV
jgi:hypothetical protein